MLELKALGKQIAIVSSSFREQIMASVDLHDLSTVVEVLLGAEDAEQRKPAPDLLFRTMVLLGAKKT